MSDTAREIAKALKSRSVANRLEAVRRSRLLSSEEKREMLLRALVDRSNLVVAEAAKALIGAGDSEVATLMIERYTWFAADGPRRDPGCVARWQLITALASYGDRRAAPLFFNAIETVQIEPSGAGLEDMAVGLRGQAALALSQLGLPGALLAISVLLFDDDPKVPTAPQEAPFATLLARRMAIQALSNLGDPGAVVALGLKLAYPNEEVPEVLVECMDAIARLDDKAALKLIPPYLSERNPYLVAGAATALAALSAAHLELVLDLLVDACLNQSQEAREAIALAIASMRGDDAFWALGELSTSEDPSVRMAVIPAVAHKGGAPAKEILSRLVDDPDTVVAHLARKSLDQMEV